MKRMFFALLMLLIIGALTVNAADKILMSEDWEFGIINPTKWSLGGNPMPQIQSGGYNSSYALNSNGDNFCDSAAHTLSWFITKNGIIAEFWLKPFKCQFCFYSTSRAGFTTSDLIDSGQCGPFENYYQGLAYVELNTGTSTMNYYVKNIGLIFSEAYPDYNWHKYRIQINTAGNVSFYRDGQLKAASNIPLNLNFNIATKFQYWGQANFGPNLIDDIIIAEPETTNLVFDSEVDNYSIVSVNPPVQLPPQALKGKVRITVKVQTFIDFQSNSALLISFSSLDERYRFGDGSIQVALPENVSPVYDAFRTKWEYYNPGCGEAFFLEIPQMDCDDAEYLTNLMSGLYPNGSAVNSALGLESSIECLDNLDYPYEGTLFSALNTHDTLNYLWLDPADGYCPDGESHDGKEITIFIPIEESAADAISAINESEMALNAKFSVVDKSDGMIYEIDILADQLSP